MTTSPVTTSSVATPSTAVDVALQVSGLRKAFGDVVAVDGVDLALASGELVALVGPSGCGKSTLIRLIAGLITPDEGTVRLGGTVVSGDRVAVPPEKRRIGVVFQDHSLFPHLTVAKNIAFGLRGHPQRERRARVAEVLDLVDLTGLGGRYPHELSGGQRQRVGLARALAPAPDVVLLDEPFASLDPNLRARIRAETVGILRRAGATSLLVTHDQIEALAMGDRVAVMGEGRLEQLDVPETVFSQPASRFVATFLGEADFLPAQPHAGHLHTEAGPCPAPVAAAEGEVMVRPHEVAMASDPHGNAVVVASEYQGSHMLYEVRLDSGRRLRSLQAHTERFAVGDRVQVRLVHGHPPAVLP